MITYLDPQQMRQTNNWGQWAIKIAAAAAVIAIGWFALTAGNEDGTVRPEIVPEPVASDPADPAPQ